ncbi:unnamed protein product [Anisakis simplex]|uniref:TM2 domain-containing protein n=1 Tax=Anisakis simplex TaxID=6269 RepID=A0A0M3JTX1_ANISI|nr:unnamed protein product [Anisakis simplex]
MLAIQSSDVGVACTNVQLGHSNMLGIEETSLKMSVGGSLTYYNALRARTWLMLGGQLGLHRLYLDEPLEAFVYFATGGIFLFGIFYDIFAIHSIVERQNARIKRSSSRATREMISSEKFASSSIKRFIAQFLFGYWMGLIYGLTMLFTFSIQRRPILLSIIIAIGVAKDCHLQNVYFPYPFARRTLCDTIWQSWRPFSVCQFKTFHTQNISRKLIHNTNKSIFSSGSQIQYIPFKPNSPYRQSTTANSFIFNHASMDDKRRVSDKRWWSIFLMDMVTSESENINLVDYVIVFVSDYLRAEALSRMTEQKLRTDNAHRFDALEWTAWRQLAIYVCFFVTAFI